MIKSAIIIVLTAAIKVVGCLSPALSSPWSVNNLTAIYNRRIPPINCKYGKPNNSVANEVNNTLIITAPIQPIIMVFNFCLSGSLLHAIAIKIALSPLKIKSNDKILPRAANHAAENMPSTYSSLLSKLICIILMI